MISDTIERLVVRVKPVKISSNSNLPAPSGSLPSEVDTTVGASADEPPSLPPPPSLYVFSHSNALRRACRAAAEHAAFAAAMLVLVAANTTVILIEESVYASLIPAHWSSWLDIVFCVLFAIEGAVKIVAHGFVFCGPKSYILDKWNAFDFVVWLLSYVSFLRAAVSLQCRAQPDQFIRIFLAIFLYRNQALVHLGDQY
jgi:hypothetical protein